MARKETPPLLLSLLVASLLVLAACASPAPTPEAAAEEAAELPPPSVPDEVFTGWLKSFKDCRAKYAEIDRMIDDAGVRDSGYYRVPGFPYLRTDRTLASFRNEVHSVDEVGGWLRRMREFDQEAREFELQNLGLGKQQLAIWRFELLGCGRGLANIELDDPAIMERLLKSVVPPAEYPRAARSPGKPDAQLGARLSARQQTIAEAFARPLATLDAPGAMLLWKVKPVQDMSLIAKGYGNPILDELGFPGLIDSAWAALAEANAPLLWIETAGDADRPGTPRLTDSGPAIDIARPEVHYQVTFTRFGEQRLPQLNYLFWFKGRGAAALDGFIWRVTLDAQAKPLVYESLHLSGRDHQWFPAQSSLRLRAVGAAGDLPPLLPQKELPAGTPVLRIQSGSHALRRIVALEQAAPQREIREFELRRYEDLTALPRPDGSTRSLFDPLGEIPDVRDPDPFWTLGVGVRDPGALRQLGHHASTYVRRREFDDPFLLESVFLPPDPVALTEAPTQ